MVHSAYDSIEVVKGCPSKIESIAYHSSALLLACSDASLRVYAPPDPPSSADSSDSLRRQPYVLHRTLASFSKRPVSSLQPLPSCHLLLSLSDAIFVHHLPKIEPLALISKSKGANAFAWDDRRSLLCFSRQKRIALFRCDGGRDFVEVKEYSIPDVVKSIAWCGENICLGIRKEYMILNIVTGALSEVFPSGRIAAPMVVPFPSGELILGKDNIGVLVDQNGKLQKDGRILWSEAPSSVVIHVPYAIACLPRHIEIRSLRAPYPLVQTVALRDVRLLVQSNSCVIAAIENSVFRLLPVPLGAQIIQLTASGNFEEALALCKLLPPEDSNLRASKESSIHIRYGHYLFDNGSYEEAMEQFLASSVDITYVLSLYPSIVIPKLLTVSEPEKVPDLGADTSDLSRGSSDASDEMELASPSLYVESEEKSALELKKMSHNALMGLIKFLHKKRFSVIGRATAEVTEEVVSDAVQDGITSFHSYRSKGSSKNRGNMHVSSRGREMATILDTALLQALLLTGQSSAALELLKGPNYCDVKICAEVLKQKNHYTALLELYRCNAMYREALTLLNQLVEESKSEQPQIELTEKFKPEMMIEFLKRLCSTDPMLVLEFSLHALESCPSETFELYLSGNVPADMVNSYLKTHAPNLQARYLELMAAMNENSISTNLQNELVQLYLSEVLDWYSDLKTQQKWDEKAYSPTRKKLISALEGISVQNAELLLKRLPSDGLYEECAILLGKMNQHQLALSLYVYKLHLPELALAYCDRFFEAGQHIPSSKSSTNVYLMLLQIYLNPRRAAEEFEHQIENLGSAQNIGVQKSAHVKVKGGRGAKKVAEIEGAEDTCISTSGTDSARCEGDGDETCEGVSIMIDEVLELLSRKWDRINGAQALRLLPKDTKLQNLISFLEPLLKKSSESHRNFSVIKSLRNCENLQVKDELYKLRRTVVKINIDSVCSLCNKRIGTSVFAVYPNGKTLVHFVCFRDSQNIKAVRAVPLQRR